MSEVEVFSQYRPLLFGLAYRMLGSVMDAEDIVQESFLRWQQVHGDEVASPKSYLTTVATRLCIDHLRSARARREEYVGPWLPEPLATRAGADDTADVADTAALAESLSLAFLVLLESLTPVERAVFLLHEVFGYAHDEIARITGKSAANCRQIAGRARRHIDARRPRFDPSPARQEQLTLRFMRACATGDMAALLALLSEDITLWADGGGKAQAARRPIHGASNVARFALGIVAKAPTGFTARVGTINGQPGIVAEIDGHVISVLALQTSDDHIVAIRVIANPDKLRAIGI